MKKYLIYLMTVVLVSIVSFNLVSCGGGDDDDFGDGTGVVGKWDGTSRSGDKVTATFKSNSTGTLEWTIIDDGTYYETESFTYVKDSDTSGTMTVKYADNDDSSRGDSGSSTYLVMYSISGDAMTLKKASTGSVLATLTRRTN